MAFAIKIIEPNGSTRWFAPNGRREEFYTYKRAERVAVRLAMAGGQERYEVVEINVG